MKGIVPKTLKKQQGKELDSEHDPRQMGTWNRPQLQRLARRGELPPAGGRRSAQQPEPDVSQERCSRFEEISRKPQPSQTLGEEDNQHAAQLQPVQPQSFA